MVGIWSDRHFWVFVDYRARVVLVVRSAAPFGDAAELAAGLARLDAALRPADLGRKALLLDARAAPAIAPALEGQLSAWSARVFGACRACAVLVRTTPGVAQAKRVKARSPQHVLVTSSVREAAEHVGAACLVQALGPSGARPA